LAVRIVRQPKKIVLLGAPSSAAALRAGHERAPAALRAAGLAARLERAGFEVVDAGDIAARIYQQDDEHPRARNFPAVLAALHDLRPRVELAIKSGALPLITETNVDEWIEQQRAALFTRGEAGVYLAIEVLEGHDLAGFVQLAYHDRDRTCAGFTLAIHPPRRRQGLGLEAARAVIDFAFDSLCARRISVHCASQEDAACRMLEKAGLRKEGEFVKSRFDGKEWITISYYALLKEERSPASSSSDS